MNINASIVDQRVLALCDLLTKKKVFKADTDKIKSAAFVALCMNTVLQLEIDEAFDLLTEGGGDAGVDGIYVEDVEDSEFTVNIFQGKYKKDLEGNSNFGENAVKKMIDIVSVLFDPRKDITVNHFLRVKMEEIRSYVRDGYIPTVRVFLCNNGLKWNDTAQKWIDQSGFGSQVSWHHINHDNIITILQGKKPVDDSIILSGEAIIEEFNYRRVLVGKIPVLELKKLFDKNGDKLLDRNIRRYLGLRTNRVNASIGATLKSPEQRENFYFFNNGITMICNKFAHNALQGSNYQVQVKGMQVINGGQTCKTIQKTLEEERSLFDSEDALKGVTVMLRLYELPQEEQDFVSEITFATNSQNPVDLKDLKSNDDMQKTLEISIKELGYIYRRQREEGVSGPSVITPAVAASAVLAAWMNKPHQAKFRASDHFGKLYEDIFEHLNGAQLIIAVLILRFVENLRKRPKSNHPEFVPYASYFIAMLIAKRLLDDLSLTVKELTHINYSDVLNVFKKRKDEYYSFAIEEIKEALKKLYGKNSFLTLQRLSATFRRGDLLTELGY